MSGARKGIKDMEKLFQRPGIEDFEEYVPGSNGARPAQRPISSFLIPPDNDPSILLGNRFLNRGDGAVLSSTSGMGKSSLSIQLAVHWALGRAALASDTTSGIGPNGPLRSLIIQSEDSDGDVAEVWAGIAHSLDLTPDERAQVDQNLFIVTDRVNRGLKFRQALKAHIAQTKPDLVWINPLQAFMDGDVTQSQDLGKFLREELNSLNEPASFAYILVHHTAKPATGKDRSERQWHEVMYDMAGGAEIINWARAILSLRPAADEGNFNLILAKRGRRAGFTRLIPNGAAKVRQTETVIPLCHAKGTLQVPSRAQPLPIIFWEPREPDVPTQSPRKGGGGGRPSKYDFNDFKSVFPPKSSNGLDLSKLHHHCVTNCPIPKKSLGEALKRWEEEGAVEIIRPESGPMRYRLAV